MHVSGVLAVVVTGLYLGHHAPQAGYATRLRTLVALRDAGRIDDEVLSRILHDLDLEEAMLTR